VRRRLVLPGHTQHRDITNNVVARLPRRDTNTVIIQEDWGSTDTIVIVSWDCVNTPILDTRVRPRELHSSMCVVWMDPDTRHALITRTRMDDRREAVMAARYPRGFRGEGGEIEGRGWVKVTGIPSVLNWVNETLSACNSGNSREGLLCNKTPDIRSRQVNRRSRPRCSLVTSVDSRTVRMGVTPRSDPTSGAGSLVRERYRERTRPADTRDTRYRRHLYPGGPRGQIRSTDTSRRETHSWNTDRHRSNNQGSTTVVDSRGGRAVVVVCRHPVSRISIQPRCTRCLPSHIKLFPSLLSPTSGDVVVTLGPTLAPGLVASLWRELNTSSPPSNEKKERLSTPSNG